MSSVAPPATATETQTPPLTYEEFASILKSIDYPNTRFIPSLVGKVWSISIEMDVENACHDDHQPRIRLAGGTTIDEEDIPTITREKIIKHAFEALMIMVRHEAGHFFTVDGEQPFDGHKDGDVLGIAIYYAVMKDKLKIPKRAKPLF